MKKIGIFLSLCIIFLWALPVYGKEQLSKEAEIHVEYGFRDNVKTGNNIPVKVIIKNKGEAFDGYIKIDIPVKEMNMEFSPETWIGGDGLIGERNQIYSSVKNISLEKEETKEEIFYQDIPLYNNVVNVELWSDGKRVTSESTSVDISGNQSRLLVGIISQDLRGMDELKNMSVVVEEGYSENLFVKIIVLNPEDIYDSQSALEQLDILITDADTPFTEKQTLALKSWKNQGGFWLERNGESLKEMVYQLIYGSRSDEFRAYIDKIQTYSFQNIVDLDLVPVNYRPSMGKFVIVLAAYICLAGPGLYIFLKKKKKQKFIWIGTILLALGFTGIIKIMSLKTSFSAPFISYCGEYEQMNGIWSENSQIGIQAPFNHDIQLYLDNGYEIENMIVGYEGNADSENVHAEKVIMEHQEDATRITMKNTSSFHQNYFKLRKNKFLKPEQEVQIQLTGNGTSIEGSWNNPTPYDISSGLLVTQNRIAVLGKLESGKTGQVSEKPLISHSIDGVLDVLKAQMDFDGYDFPEYEMERLAQKAERLEKDSAPGSSYFLGIVDNPDLTFQKDSGYKVYGSTLLTIPIQVNWEKDGSTWLPNLEAYGKPVEGEYSSSTNLMGNHSVTVDYEIHGIDQVEMLQIFSAQYYADKYFIPFQGEIFLYNWEEKGYELISDWEQEIHGENVQKYISGLHMLRVRYILDDTLNSSEQTPVLPCIQVMGKGNADAQTD